MSKQFTVPCVAEIDNHIGKAEAIIIGDSPTDWYVDCIVNKWGGERSAESISPGLYEEIEAEVQAYFAGQEAQSET